MNHESSNRIWVREIICAPESGVEAARGHFEPRGRREIRTRTLPRFIYAAQFVYGSESRIVTGMGRV